MLLNILLLQPKMPLISGKCRFTNAKDCSEKEETTLGVF